MHFFNPDKKLVEHEKGEHFLKMFELTMSIPNDILEKSLYFTSNIDEIGKEREFYEVLNIYFIILTLIKVIILTHFILLKFAIH